MNGTTNSHGLTLELAQASRSFRPGASLEGQASWALDEKPESLEIRLIWYTEGKGTEDVGVVDTVVLPNSTAGSEPFQFWLPDGPYSFSGKLITLHWALELIAEPQHKAALENFILSPTGQEVILPTIESAA